MNLIKVIKAIIDLTNGKKTDTGSIVTVIAAVLVLSGISQETEAVSQATSIMMGFGAVILIVGRIHARIKAVKGKNVSDK